MIEKWRLSNFKSIYDSTELTLHPLTIFAGANSSGKSTFIQSMLVVAQTLTNQVYSRPVILNGHIARLGKFSDLASSGNNQDEISVGFTLSATEQSSQSQRGISPRRYPLYRDNTLHSLSCDFSFSAYGEPPKILQLQPRLTKLTLSSRHKDDTSPTTIEIKWSSTSVDERQEELKLERDNLSSLDVASLSYEVTQHQHLLDSVRRRYYMPRTTLGEPVGCNLSHFLPRALTVRYDSTVAKAQSAIEYLFSFELLQQPMSREPDSSFLPPELIHRVEHLYREVLQEGTRNIQIPEEQTGIDRLRFIRRHFRLSQERLNLLMTEHKTSLIELSKGAKPSSWALDSVPAMPEETSYVQQFFGELFKYLGPLRDEPKAVYPLEGARSPWDVGLRGEYTAAVLDLYKNTTISYVPSDAFRMEDGAHPVVEATLQKAVSDWLKYLEISRGVETEDLGLLGHDLRVSLEGDTFHNLVHVGVGVSQVLPILVMSLLADPGSVLVFEQPELHLNPKVQTLLADFLLSVIWGGKQCIIETHSEYIINRLRLRAALDEADQVSKDVALYFVEKIGLRSRYRSIRMNEFGAINEWPEGFFDQTPREAEKILRAAVAKRRKKASRDV